MKILSPILPAMLLLCVATFGSAQVYETHNVTVQTFVGSGFYGHYDGVGQLTMFNHPTAITADSSSNLFVLDSQNYLIRKITPAGTVTTFVGGGQATPPGLGTNVSLNYVSYSGMAMDRANTLWLAPAYGNSLLKITPDGLVLPIQVPGISAVGGMCVDSQNNLYLSDSGANRIFRYTTNGALEIFAGSGNPGNLDGNWIFTSFHNPTHLAADLAGNIYVWDSASYLIRRISQNRDVVTLAGRGNASPQSDGLGTNAVIYGIHGMTVDAAGNLIFTSGSPWVFPYQGLNIRKMSSSANVTTIAGNFLTSGYANGAGSNTLFLGAQGLCVVGDDIYVADTASHRIRKISMDAIPPVAMPANLELKTYPGVSLTGTIGRTYRIESSITTTNWTTETEVLLTTSPQVWIDPNAVQGTKYYRAVLLP